MNTTNIKKNTLPIGVFDSGMGGLTVLKALQDNLPLESFIYLGDTARLPYGTKSLATIQQYALQMANFLVKRNIKALVIACNTATTAALVHLQQVLVELPVIGVIAPGAQTAAMVTKNNKIAVLATETTIASQAYQNHILQHLPSAQIKASSASLLVALAEEGMLNNHIAVEVFKYYLSGIEEEDTLLLGCTHFPVFKPLLSTLLPTEMKIVDSAEATARMVRQRLESIGLLSVGSSNVTQFLATDSIDRFKRVGQYFLGDSIKNALIELVDV